MDKKININMVGGGFQHDICSSAGSTPKIVNWVKDFSSNISIHIDKGMKIKPKKDKINFAWIQESPTINKELNCWIRNNIKYLEDNFELIFTHNRSLLSLSKKFKFVICNAKSWIKEEDFKIYPKTKLISTINSNKNLCPEHQFRINTIEKFKNEIDVFGRGYNEIDYKLQGLKDYYFSLVIENCTYSLSYSEKLMDCLVTGTIPIYYGCKDIKELYNEEGIIWLTDDFKIKDLSPELYYSKLKFIEENYNKAIQHPTAEDWIYLNFIQNYKK